MSPGHTRAAVAGGPERREATTARQDEIRFERGAPSGQDEPQTETLSSRPSSPSRRPMLSKRARRRTRFSVPAVAPSLA